MSPMSVEILNRHFEVNDKKNVVGVKLGRNTAILIENEEDGGKLIIAREANGKEDLKKINILLCQNYRKGETENFRLKYSTNNGDIQFADIKVRAA
jgi:hypothetical protein